MSKVPITVAHGDGIGPEIMAATLHILEESGADLEIETIDIGEKVYVDAWNVDGTAIVRYRGAQWTVVSRAGSTPSAGEHKVTEVIGSRLVVEKV